MVPSFRELRVAVVILLCTMLVSGPSLHAQDFIFSQFFNAPMHLNPAYVGMNGGLTSTISYRRQWNQIPQGFNSLYFSVDSFEPCLPGAVGFSVARDVEGQ
ncbi:MAG: type IX secretion system membrane protein PorP/SprF, partial [Bacteroidota bacterium]